MSAKKPPPRPPLPRTTTARSGQPTGVAPERSIRNAFASISIRYSSSNKELDSDEEISIERKENRESHDRNDSRLRIEGENEEDGFCKVTVEDYEQLESVDPSRQEVDKHTEAISNAKKSSSEAGLKLASKSHSTQELRATSEKRSIVQKQSTWPSYLRSEDSDSVIMKFLRGRGDQGNEPKSEPAKEGLSLPEQEIKEENDVGSIPSKTHVDEDLQSKLTVDRPRSRSPSPFRRKLNRDRQDENTRGGAEQEKPKSSAGISLSSLLASLAKDEAHVEPEEIISDTEENESSADINSEIQSSSDLSFNLNHFEETRNTKAGSDVRHLPHPTVDKSPHFANFCFCSLIVYIYFITSSPPFMSGVVLGGLLTYLGGCAFLWLFCPVDSIAERYEKELMEYEQRLARTPTLDYKSTDPGLLLERNKLEGWMFKSFDYIPDKFEFSAETIPVFASLNVTNLKLSHPHVEDSGKKFDPRSIEEGASVSFSKHEHYDLTGSKVSLLPASMTMKKVWSRKFPICLALEKLGTHSEDVSCFSKSADEESGAKESIKIKEQDSLDDVGVLYLFARTGREKEDWYNHLCRLLNDNSGNSSDLETPPLCSYPQYMAKLIAQPSQQSEIAWVNVMFGRVFWDVWHDKYWTNKIKERFENKLAKMKKPSFIRDISISDLNLGQSLPVITKTSSPKVEHDGTWVDLEVTYSGGLILTFEGHLNIEGYLSYFLSLGNSEHAELEMAELSRKYENLDKESLGAAELDNDSGSESPPDSDSDFESPESDFEEFMIKPLGTVQSGREKLEDIPQSESSDSFTLSSFDGDEELLESKDPLSLSNATDAEEGNSSLEKSTQPRRRQLSSQKQSSSEELSDKGLLTEVLPEKTSESAPSTPMKKLLGLSTKNGPKRKILSVIERLAKSKWVKKAAETGIVKRAAERFSNLPIILSVEVLTVKGTLALNIPPPPTNRLWYGFRGSPMLFVSARPKLGERQVKLTHVTDWIEKKLKQEFKNMFVLPNMEDLPIRLMNSGLEEQFPHW
ncbi:unnamed protein product [Pocillopora meandrina]|uniref:SMP-LTD domain-containing protein n=1 Tax=Pocillopora meandrina TaxID=46732 RepID=A0AAU9X4S1_9CNID|nr:unnamed protein product [Pocillopora meandrina]